MKICSICGEICNDSKIFAGHMTSHSDEHKKSMAKLGIEKRLKNESNYHKEPRQCQNCGLILSYDKRKSKFCNRSCANESIGCRNGIALTKKSIQCLKCNKKVKNYRSRKGERKYCSFDCQKNANYETYIDRWKNGLDSGMSGKYGIRLYIRIYLFNKYNSKCCKCGWGEINNHTSKIPLQINHIDGNYMNNNEENLELICPNCHSLTHNYGSLNRGKGRSGRHK